MTHVNNFDNVHAFFMNETLNLTNLKTVSLQGNHFSYISMNFLNGSPLLQELDPSDNIANLTRLNLKNNLVSNLDLLNLDGAELLNELRISKKIQYRKSA